MIEMLSHSISLDQTHVDVSLKNNNHCCGSDQLPPKITRLKPTAFLLIKPFAVSTKSVTYLVCFAKMLLRFVFTVTLPGSYGGLTYCNVEQLIRNMIFKNAKNIQELKVSNECKSQYKVQGSMVKFFEKCQIRMMMS